MDKKNVIKKESKAKIISVCIKITKAHSLWLKEHKFSPTAIFSEGCKELGYKCPDSKE